MYAPNSGTRVYHLGHQAPVSRVINTEEQLGGLPSEAEAGWAPNEGEPASDVVNDPGAFAYAPAAPAPERGPASYELTANLTPPSRPREKPAPPHEPQDTASKIFQGALEAWNGFVDCMDTTNKRIESTVNRMSRPKWEFRPGYKPYCQRSFDAGRYEYEVMVFRRPVRCVDHVLKPFF